jgi:nitrate reductase NapE component
MKNSNTTEKLLLIGFITVVFIAFVISPILGTALIATAGFVSII